MLILTNLQRSTKLSLINYLPKTIKGLVYGFDFANIEEIRLRLGLPLRLYFNDKAMFVSKTGQLTTSPRSGYIVRKSDIDEAMSLISASSVYAVENQIKEGYLTLDGGHRVGLCGRSVVANGKISFITDICGLNYRYAREVIGCSDDIIETICNNEDIHNTLVISPPGCGKTTMLRDITRQLSLQDIKIGVVDERSEIAGMCDGKVSFDLGYSVDVLDACPKAEGMLLLLRSMSPQVIVVDELGKKDDITAVESIINSGVKVVASIHGYDYKDIESRVELKRLIKHFNCFVTLTKNGGTGRIHEVKVR